MKYLYILLAVAAVALVIGACKSTKKVATVSTESPAFTLTKGKCRGKCKAFTFSGFDNHSLTFVGIKNVDYIGLHSSNLSAKVYDELIAQLVAADLGSMENEYLATVKDLPTLELSFKGKTIRFHKQKAPDALRQVVTILDEIAFAQAWESAE
ncbi:MAG: DUF6438 domain-containing protein [Saprospiraceae bacterium]